MALILAVRLSFAAKSALSLRELLRLGLSSWLIYRFIRVGAGALDSRLRGNNGGKGE
jgi:hypothetical protein